MVSDQRFYRAFGIQPSTPFPTPVITSACSSLEVLHQGGCLDSSAPSPQFAEDVREDLLAAARPHSKSEAEHRTHTHSNRKSLSPPSGHPNPAQHPMCGGGPGSDPGAFSLSSRPLWLPGPQGSTVQGGTGHGAT